MRSYRALVPALVLAAASAVFGQGDLLDAPGVRNFHQVNDHVYRGAQPTGDGFKSLAKIGVHTVIDLREGREFGGDEKKYVEGSGMHYVHVPFAGLAAPTDEQIATVFNVLEDPTAWPVFVHCRRGADRTGTVIACYRIAHDHWDKEKALNEAKMHGMSRIEVAMKNYILRFEPPVKHTPDLKTAASSQ